MKKEDLIDNLSEKYREYDLSLVPNEFTYNTDLNIICHKKDALGNEHGIFTIKYDKIKRGDGCLYCSGRKMNKEQFIAEATHIHGNLYNYDDFIYVNKKTKGKIHCNKHNIDFLQTPSNHLKGHGCPKCRYEKSALSNTKSTKDFIEKAKEIHGNKYDYSKTEYVNSDTKVEIICHEKDEYGNEHGSFFMTPTNHCHLTNPQGCPKCGRKHMIHIQRSNSEDFIEKAKNIHNDKYDYFKTEYVNNTTKVIITCPIHGDFEQTPSNHLIGQGCPKCGKIMSKGENEIYDFLKNELNLNVKQHIRDIISPFELDIYIPDKKIAIEYNGLIWHSEKYEKSSNLLLKTNLCEEQGIRLIHIFEDEWLEHSDIIKSKLSNIFNNTNNRVFARKCILKEVPYLESKRFLDENHIQGSSMSMYRYGLYYNNELVSLMTFGRLRQMKKNANYDNEYELLRFCNKLNTSVVGGASKLLNHFIKKHHPKTIVSYADKRWSIGNLYNKLGFVHTHDSKPNYFYIVKGKRKNRFLFRKNQLVKKYDCPIEMSEHQFMLSKGYYRIYDCGTKVYKLFL